MSKVPVTSNRDVEMDDGIVVRSVFAPRVRDGLCRRIRNKGMIIHMDEKPENASSLRSYLEVDKNARAWDNTTWWCTSTSKTVGPDDKPCDVDRCKSGRGCFESEDRVA